MQKSDLEQYIFGKNQPQAIDAEKIVLGTVLMVQDSLYLINDFLTTDMFYLPQHQFIYQAITHLHEKAKPVDLVTVPDELKRMGKLEEVGGYLYVGDLTNQVGSTATIESHARIVAEKYIAREVIVQSTKAIQKGYDETTDPFDLVSDMDLSIDKLRRVLTEKKEMSLKQIVQEEVADEKNGKEVRIVRTGFALDEKTGGFHGGDVITLAGRPGEGKTAFLLNIAKRMGLKGDAVGMFSLEMNGHSLLDRMVSDEVGIDNLVIRNKKFSKVQREHHERGRKELINLPFYIDDDGYLDGDVLRTKARRMVKGRNVQMIAIDYIQIMNAPKQRYPDQIIGESVKAIKRVAKELNVPALVLSQIKRQENEKSKYSLSDLKYSGTLEEGSDVVMFLWRPDMHGEKHDEKGEDNTGKVKLLIRKNKNGEVGELDMEFEGRYQRFSDVDSKGRKELFDEEGDIPF